jgi:hypothetical protein
MGRPPPGRPPRPERLSVAGCDPAAIGPRVNTLRATVDDVAFLGSVVRLRLRCADQVFQVDALSDPEHVLARAGESVSVVFPPEACLLLSHSMTAPAVRRATT